MSYQYHTFRLLLDILRVEIGCKTKLRIIGKRYRVFNSFEREQWYRGPKSFLSENQHFLVHARKDGWFVKSTPAQRFGQLGLFTSSSDLCTVLDGIVNVLLYFIYCSLGDQGSNLGVTLKTVTDLEALYFFRYNIGKFVIHTYRTKKGIVGIFKRFLTP